MTLRAAGMLFVLVACMALATQVRADLPIHCLNSQVAGEWEFTLNEGRHSLPSSGDLSGVSCGYPQPDRNADHFTRPPVLVAARTVKVSLREPNIAVDAAGNKGTWTMVYDEGFEVRVGGRVYFAYSKYTPNSGTSLSSDKVAHYTSHCDETMVGWVHADDNSQWGCFRGKQTKAANAWAKPVSRVKDDGKDLAPVVSPTVLLEEFVRILPRDTDVEATLPAPESSARETVLLEEDAEVDVSADRGVRMAGEEMGDEEPVMEPLNALLSQTATELPELDESVLFEPDHVFIERHNRNSRNLWKAKSPVELEHKPVAHMLRMLGLRRYNKENTGPGGVKLRQPIHDTRPDKVKYAGLPEEWDWSDRNGISYDTEIRNQGSCGSCYAMASISALEARYRIKSRLAFRPVLSPQEVVSCSFYNQGCQGGYPFLVAKHGSEFGMVDAECAPYTARNSECRVGACKNERLRMHNYSYVGGYMGGCSEAAMMREIYANGPVMVAFQAPPDLFYYTGGIYTGPSPKQESQGNVPGVNVWQQTNHAVVAVGWGVDRKTGTKFWKVKNTWGLKWGERGYFRIRRGTNECGIESMATKADVILPDSVTVPADAPDPWAPEVRGAKKHVARMRKARTVKASRKHKRGY